MRIISLAPSNTEILYRLDAEEKIAATTSLCDHPEKALEKPSVGGWSRGIDFQKIADLEPDLILASDDLQNRAVEKLREKDFKAVQFRPHTLEEVFESVENIGKLVGRIDRAEEIIEEAKSGLEQLDLNGKRVYCEEWMKPPMISGNWIPGLIDRINGEYMIGEGQRSREVNVDEVRDFDPEHIILNVCGAGENIDKDRILKRNGWENITAVENKNIHVVDDALLNRPGPRLVKGAEKIAKLVR